MLKNDVLIQEGDKGRVTFLDVEGETVIVSIYSRAIVLDDFVPEAQKVIDTVKWGGS